MTTIKGTPAFNDQLNTIREAGKTPWVIINEGYVVGAYSGRTQAREAKAAEGLEGKILKADEIEFEVVDLAAAAQALQDEAAFDEIQESSDLEDRLCAAFAAADAEKPSAIQAVAEEAAPAAETPVVGEFVNCPHCGTHLSNGVGYHGQEVNGKTVKHDAFEWGCLACGEEFGPAIPTKAEKKVSACKIEVTNESTVARPCKLVWHIADEMKAANPEVERKEVLAECVKRGVAFYTARTQYQQWLGVQKEMAARVASQTAE